MEPTTELDLNSPYLGIIEKYRPKPDTNTLEEQRKIARSNALASALGLIVDAVGGSKGADIQQKNILDPVNKAVDKYNTTRDNNRREQLIWDQAAMGQELKGMEKESDRKYQDQVLNKQIEEKRRTETINRQQDREKAGVQQMQFAENMNQEKLKVKQQNEQFLQEMGLKREAEANDYRIKKQEADTEEMRYKNVYRYGNDNPVVSDPDTQKEVIIPKQKANQVLSWIADDPNVKGDMTFLQMKYGKYPSETIADMIIADTYSRLAPETRAQIRQFVGDNSTATPQAPGKKAGEQFLFYKNPAQQTPAAKTAPAPIKTQKGSTMVTVEQPKIQGSADVTPDQVNDLMKIKDADSTKYTPDQKAKMTYNYLINAGATEEFAGQFADYVYKKVGGK